MGQLRSKSGTGKHFVHIPGNGAKRQLISGRVDVHYQGTGGYRSPRAGFFCLLRSALLRFQMHLYQCGQKEIPQHPLMCSEHPKGASGLQAQLHTLRAAHPECKQQKNRNRQNAS